MANKTGHVVSVNGNVGNVEFDTSIPKNEVA